MPAARAADREWVVAVMGDSRRQGRWRVERPLAVVAVMGDVVLDLRGAEVPQGEVDISATAVMGDVKVYVPDGVDVQLSGIAVMGDKKVMVAAAGRSRVVVKATILMGDIKVIGDSYAEPTRRTLRLAHARPRPPRHRVAGGRARRPWAPKPCSVRSPFTADSPQRRTRMIVADVSFADIFWSMLWFFFLFIWIMILVHILSDLFRDHTLSSVTKTLWVLFLVFLPFLAVLIYLIVRGQGMAERAATPPAAGPGAVRRLRPDRRHHRRRQRQPDRADRPSSSGCWMPAPSTRRSSSA